MIRPAPERPCTCFRLRRAARLLSRHYDQALKPSGTNVNQFSILRRAEAATLPLGVLAGRLGMDRTTLSRDLKPLLAAGSVELVPGDDPRQRCVRLTDGGRRQLAAALPLWRAAQAAVDDCVGTGAIDALHEELERTTVSLAARAAATASSAASASIATTPDTAA